MITEQFGLAVENFEFNKKGIIKGIASNFNKPIMHGGMINIISSNAFSRSLASGSHIPLLNQHNMQDPIGVFNKLQPVDGALRFEAQIVTESQSGANAFALAKAGALRGVSIGFSPAVTRYGKDKQGRRVRYLDDVDLHEISLVTVPADKEAQIEVAYAEDFDEASVEFDKEDPIGEFDAKGAFTLLEERLLKLEEKIGSFKFKAAVEAIEYDEDCVSRKMKMLVDEGKDPEDAQTIAIAINHCKEMKHKEAEAKKETHSNSEAVTVDHLSLIAQLEEMQRDLMLKEVIEE